jgi:hemoglobin
MKNHFLSLGLACAVLMSAPAMAQSMPAPAMPASGMAQTMVTSDALYQSFGQKAGIAKVIDNAVDRWMADPRIKPFFKDTVPQRLKFGLTEQVCQLTGGPCTYTGQDMKTAHATMGVNKAAFNNLVEGLQFAMDDEKIPFTVQNRLLALLAPMNRDIITVR